MKIRKIAIAYTAILVLLSLFLCGRMCAQGATRDTIVVHPGWNMIGATQTINTAMIGSTPAGIITSPYFGYFPSTGYSANAALERGVGYWVKASQDGKIILNDSVISVFTCGTSTVEYSGKTYHTVQIGAQCWLRENLDVGTMIDSFQNASDNGVIEKYCYHNDPANCATYGGLYQWNEAMQYSTTPGSRGICPSGWHIPTNEEFQTLSSMVGGDGNALKAIGQGTGAGTGTNTSGFSALLAGSRSLNGSFRGLGDLAFVWSSSQYVETRAYYMRLDLNGSDVYQSDFAEYVGFSVRCVED